ncbi:MAG: hypothetical protein DDT41_01652 [candidate division WS2 bacterium]|nr:hypothetical protein [Candidatus Psychracetigena formicireducens]
MEYGHQKIRQYKLFWTEDSLNGIKEQRNFRYITDKNGNLTDKTTHMYSHLQDACRYAVIGKEGYKDKQEKIIIYDSRNLVNMIEY